MSTSSAPTASSLSGPTPVIISGVRGRMGQAIWRLAAADPEFRIVGGLEHVARTGEATVASEAPIVSDLAALAAPAGTILVEFTTPEATVEHARLAAERGLRLVVGTTGLTAAQMEELRAAARATAVLQAANMSVGVNVLLDVVERLARTLAGYDIEIVEMHHRQKVDAPSGTALALARAAAAGLGENLDEIARHGRQGQTGARPAREIGLHALRGGDVVGDHTVIFAGLGERVEITHKASSRDTFAAGALRAARFLAGQGPGFYTMRDALGLGGDQAD